MKKFSFNNVNHPTPAVWSKIGAACVAVSTFICGYAITADNNIVGYIGLAIGATGTFLAVLTK